MGQNTGSNKYSHEMNAIWNSINWALQTLVLTAKKEGTLTWQIAYKTAKH
jgi:hypothetical protein